MGSSGFQMVDAAWVNRSQVATKYGVVLTLVFVSLYDRIPLAPPPESCTLFSTLFRCNDQDHWLVPYQANYYSNYVCSCILARSPGVHRIRVLYLGARLTACILI